MDRRHDNKFCNSNKIGWEICNAADYLVPKRCYKCSRYNHRHYECKGEDTYPHCTGKHKMKECTAETNETVGNHRLSSRGWEMLGNVREVSLGSVPLAAGWLRLWDAESVFERPVTIWDQINPGHLPGDHGQYASRTAIRNGLSGRHYSGESQPG